MKTKLSQKNGYTLLIVLIVMSILLTTAYFFSEGLFTDLVIARNNKGASAAFSLAEAGVQEAIYRIQYDEIPGGAKEKFMNSVDGLTSFNHDPALIANGSYSVSIQNNAKRSAVVTAVGYYQIGLGRTAQRQVKVSVAQAPLLPSDFDAGIFTTGKAGESNADVDIWSATVNLFAGSLLSNRDVNLKFGSTTQIESTVETGDKVTVPGGSTLKCNCSISGAPACATSPSCVPAEDVTERTIPSIDFNAWKQKAIGESHYYATQQQFKNAVLPAGAETNLTGNYYIDGSLDIDHDRILHLNGVLAAAGSIDITPGQLTLNPSTADQASGVFTQRDFIVGTSGNIGGTGLIYAADRVQIDTSITHQVDFIGGFISRRTWFTGFRVINITFDKIIVSNSLINPTETPIIEINHWEEEY